MNPLGSIKGVWVAGIVLAVALAMMVNVVAGVDWFNFQALEFWRWTHVIAGITWVGLLYYFNFVQMPAVAAAAAEEGGPGPAAINRHITPRALLWFRWAAVVTWLSGAIYLFMTGQFANTFSLGMAGGFDPHYGLPMGLGVWIGTIMLFNVWGIIWPGQKKILGLVQADEARIASARRLVMTASRINVILSFPMLMFMATSRSGLVF